ncbi:hypothetical protein PGIGA_G00119120 [Pangasianodon gigas]|uniref:Uncharacterized protein n=2 Tax=Pangasiidae TaxID=7999 RepID=A0ACC5XHU3_PANGG|nr:hypothetical protein [Pangasianodon gigas]
MAAVDRQSARKLARFPGSFSLGCKPPVPVSANVRTETPINRNRGLPGFNDANLSVFIINRNTHCCPVIVPSITILLMAEIKIIYHIDEEETPYLVKLSISPDEVTLADFKNVLSNRPVNNYKFFFKSMDQDFG